MSGNLPGRRGAPYHAGMVHFTPRTYADPNPRTRPPTAENQPPWMTWDEICQAYPNQVVVVDEYECHAIPPRVNGRVIGHGRTRDEAYARVSGGASVHWAVVFTGRIRGGRFFIEDIDDDADGLS